MAWYAYCISEKQAFPELARHRKPVPLQALTGISGNQIFLYPASDLAVIVSEHNPQDILDNQAARDHARIVGDCFKMSTVLPFRFGTIFADDEALRRSIRSNQRSYITHVERLRGKTEMHLKVRVEDCCMPQPVRSTLAPVERTGKQYLSNLRETATRQRERQTKGRAVAIQMQRLFAPLDEEITCRRLANGKMLLDIAHLIDARCVERYQNKFATTRELLKDCQMQLSGPWPPYHFVHRLTRPQTVAPGIPA